MQFLEHSKEIAYSAIGDDDSQVEANPQSRHCLHSRGGVWLLPAAYISLGILCCSGSFLAGRYVEKQAQVVQVQVQAAASSSSSSSPVPHNLQVSDTPVTFKPDARYGGPSSAESDVAWSSLSPPGDGFVLVHDPSQFHLPPGRATEAEGDDLYDVSVFHQLHCLTKIREHASLLRIALEGNNTVGFEKVIKPQGDHMGHCFDYLRQSIMCSGDLTLEWPREGPDGSAAVVVDGWGIQHQCKSWDAILEFVASSSIRSISPTPKLSAT